MEDSEDLEASDKNPRHGMITPSEVQYEQRSFEIDALECPSCKASPMRILVAIHPPTTTRAILNSLGLPPRAPPVTPAQPVSQDWPLSEPSVNRYRAVRYPAP